MKKLLFSAATALCCITLQAQTTLHKLIDNPSNGIFTIKMSDADAAKVKLLNIQGQEVYAPSESNGNTITIDGTMIPTGIYVLQVNSKNGIAYRKISIQ